MKRLAIIGHFGGKEEFLDGQTVKTKILYEELCNRGYTNIKIIDTYYKKKNIIKLLWQTITGLLFYKHIIVLLSVNGMKAYFPILYFATKVLGKKVYHDLIGGKLDRYVQEKPLFKTYLNAFVVNWVETIGIKKRLEKLGIYNCEVLPNFKRLPIVEAEDLVCDFKEPFAFCTFSRVMKEKGVGDAVEAIQNINAAYGRCICTLDIYGVVDSTYREEFEQLMQRVTPAVRYGGCVPFDQSVKTIQSYYGLLFPTYWAGEGFPGTMIDAFAAGVPIIASDWNSNAEILEDGYSGLIYPSNDYASLQEAIMFSVEHKEDFAVMRRNCLKEACKYMPDGHINTIVNKINAQ